MRATPVTFVGGLLALSTSVLAAAALALGSAASAVPASIPPDLAGACGTDNPYLVTVCYRFALSAATAARELAVVAFRDTGADTPRYALATRGQVGSVYGLAFSPQENALYAAAFHKRQMHFGPGGPGAIYRIDLAAGTVTHAITVPDAGSNEHAAGYSSDDARAEAWVGKTSLGDIDVSADGTELYVVNLFDRRIYRFALPSGMLLGSFAHGAVGEPWAEDARPFGLAAHAGRVFHGVVRSAQSSGLRSDLAAYVYASHPDGSDLRQVGSFALDYTRGFIVRVSQWLPRVPLAWLAWTDRPRNILDANIYGTAHPMPIASDIAFDADGNMVVGLRDRLPDMKTVSYAPDVGIGTGDTVRGVPAAAGWDLVPMPEHFNDNNADSSEITLGAVAVILRENVVVTTGMGEYDASLSLGADYGSAFWFDALTGGKQRHEGVCRTSGAQPRLAAAGPNSPSDNETGPGAVMGDLEVLCAYLPTPSPTPAGTASATPPAPPSATPTLPASPSPAPSSTPTSSPSPSPTGTPYPSPTPSPSPTPTVRPAPLYLPLLLREAPCDPKDQFTDVVLVIDASTSMRQPTRAGRPKIDAALEAARSFVARLRFPGDQAAVVAFNAEAVLLQRLTDDRAALDRALSTVVTAEFTRIDLGIQTAHEELGSPRHRAGNTSALIVLTDGHNNPEPVSTAVAAAASAKADGIRVFTIGLGDNVEAEALITMASTPDDAHFTADAEDLAAIYDRIAGVVPCPPSAHWGH